MSHQELIKILYCTIKNNNEMGSDAFNFELLSNKVLN
jgi:hypothetical protein